jgi:hypothetical protein
LLWRNDVWRIAGWCATRRKIEWLLLSGVRAPEAAVREYAESFINITGGCGHS